MSEALRQPSAEADSGRLTPSEPPEVPKKAIKEVSTPRARDIDSGKTPLIDRAERGGNIGRLLLVGLLLLGLVGLFTILPETMAKQVTLALLAFLSMIGVFFLFTVAIGFVHLSSRNKGDGFARAFVDGLNHGAVVTDWEGRIVYANHAYGELIGAESARDVATVERAFSSSDEASEIVYRMNQRVRKGQPDTQEFRMIQDVRNMNGGKGSRTPHWYRISTRPLDHPDYKKPLLVWEISDVTQERLRQESVFLELQHAIDYLDHAPAGFFSAQSDGAIMYINATLADWLGMDLTQFKPGTVNMDSLVLGDGMALLNTLEVEPGESKTAVVDLDLARSNGQSLPVRLYIRFRLPPMVPPEQPAHWCSTEVRARGFRRNCALRKCASPAF